MTHLAKIILRLFHIVGIIIMLFYISPAAFAQKRTIVGKVINKNGNLPIEQVLVKVKPIGEKQIIAFGQTSQEGVFQINTSKDLSTCELEFSCMGYATQNKQIPTDNHPLVVELTEKITCIKEVVVKAGKIGQRGDTIRYQVSAFAGSQDRNIGDVLKKMPGIEVSKTGEIKYQGQSINKFYVEGSDLLEGRYGLATNNISYKDVASVEIMENHQPIKAIRDLTFTDRSAINIKLKADARSHWVGMVKGALGFTPHLWNAELFAMRFKTKIQTINSYKSNNIGYNATDELINFAPIGNLIPQYSTIPTYINVAPSQIEDLSRNRYRFNKTHMVSSNNLVKLSKDYDLISEMNVSSNNQTSESSSQTTYFLNGNKIVVEDNGEYTKGSYKEASGKVVLNVNSDKYYLRNTLSGNLAWNDMNIYLTGSFPNMQTATIESRKLNNDFDLLSRAGKRTITIRSVNEYTSKPQSLTVKKKDPPPIDQNIEVESFLSNSSVKYAFPIGIFMVSTKAGLSYLQQSLNNKLNGVLVGVALNADEMVSQTSLRRLRGDITTTMEYNVSPFNVQLSLPVYNLHYWYKSSESTTPVEKIGMDPTLSCRWFIGNGLEIYTNTSFGKILPDEGLLYSGVILSNYRNISRGYEDLSSGNRQSTMLGIKFKDVTRMLFTSAEVVRINSNSSKLSSQIFISEYILNSYISNMSSSNMWLLNGTISKMVEGIGSTIALYPSYINSSMTVTRDKTKISYLSYIYSLRIKVSSKLASCCNIDYEVEGRKNEMKMMDGKRLFSSTNFSQTISLYIHPIEPLNIKLSVEHYNNELANDQFKNFVLADVSSSYLWGKRWEVGCSAKNIFNKQHYSYSITDGLGTISRNYKIRPINILFSVMYKL